MRRAFTLVELLVVVVIIGLLSAMAVPKFLAITGESQLDGDANALYHDLEWARLAALRASDTFVVKFTSTTCNGNPCTRWDVNEVTPVTHVFTVRKQGWTGVSVQVGLPAASYSPTNTALNGFFVNMAAFASGYRDMSSTATDACLQPVEGSTGFITTEKWSDGITFCGGSGIATPDIETGAVFLYSTRSSGKSHAIAFDRKLSLSIKHFRYMGGAWSIP